MNKTLKLGLLKAGSFLMTLAPLAVVVGLNWGHYTQTTASTVSLSAGGVSSSAMWGGTNKNIDLDTCRKTPVPVSEADKTILNT